LLPSAGQNKCLLDYMVLRSRTQYALEQCFSTAGPRPGTGPWHQLYQAARDSPGIDN